MKGLGIKDVASIPILWVFALLFHTLNQAGSNIQVILHSFQVKTLYISLA